MKLNPETIDLGGGDKTTCCDAVFTCPTGEKVQSAGEVTEDCCHTCTEAPTDCATLIPMVTGNGCYAKCTWTTAQRDSDFETYSCTDAQKKDYADAIAGTGAACSTIAATAGFCGGQMYDSGKATHTCAGTPCAAHAASDTAACCKTDTRASCSSIAASTDFCGEGKIYNEDNAANKCAGETCSKTTDIGTGSHATIGECCKTDDKCATTDGSVVPWGAKTLNYEQCTCGDNENTKGCSEGSTCDIKAVVPCTCTPR